MGDLKEAVCSQSINDAVEKLSGSIIFQMSLGSHELFHSNLWAWLLEQDSKRGSNSVAKGLFGREFGEGFDSLVIGSVEREQGHRDITIWDKEKLQAWVIENKFKSLPTAEQLVRYKNDLEQFEGGIVTGIKEPIIQLPDGWRFLSYEEIAKRLKSDGIIDSFSEEDKHVIERYAEMIEALCELMNGALDQFGESLDFDRDKKLSKELESCRVWDVSRKLQGSEFVAYLKKDKQIKSISNKAEELQFRLKLAPGFYHKKLVVDARFVREGNEYGLIGVQIEGTQFRLAVQHRADKTTPETLFTDYLERKWFEEPGASGKERKIREKPTRMRNQYCKYETKEYVFCYQYYTLAGDDFGFESLKQAIVDELEKALKIIENQPTLFA